MAGMLAGLAALVDTIAGIVAVLAALFAGTGSFLRAKARSNPNDNSSTPTRVPPTQESDAYYHTCSNGDESAPGMVSGTRRAFNVKGNGSTIYVEDGTINSGYGAGDGNFNKLAPQKRPSAECNGTEDAYNVVEGGKISVIRGSLNSGALSGNSMDRRSFVRQSVVGRRRSSLCCSSTS